MGRILYTDVQPRKHVELDTRHCVDVISGETNLEGMNMADGDMGLLADCCVVLHRHQGNISIGTD